MQMRWWMAVGTLAFAVGQSNEASAQGEPPPPPPPAGETAPPPPPPPPPPAAEQPAPAQPPAGQPPPAQPGQPPPGYYGYPAQPPPPVAPPPDEGVHEHDGFYLRLGLGYGYAKFDGSFLTTDITIEGGGTAFELLLGGTLGSGFVLGGGFIFNSLVKPDITIGDSDSIEARNNLNFGILGVFGDYYIDPKSGFHIQAMLGLANATPESSSGNDSSSVSGPGFALGAGYDFWVGDQWSIGPMGRFVYASVKNNDENVDEEYTVTGFQLLFSATLH